MNAAQALAGLWLLSLVAVAGIIVGHIVSERRTARRTRAYEQARDAAVAVRLAEDAEVAWLTSIPTMGYDPEGIGS